MAGMSRRAVIAGGFAVTVGAVVGVPLALGAGGQPSTGARLVSRARLPRPFTLPLRKPAVLTPSSVADGVERYTITARASTASILPGLRTPIFGYNGTFPGPLIESRRDHPVSVRHRNRLPIPTVVHLHGGHTPHHSDGYPTDYIYPEDLSYLQAHRSMSDRGMPMEVGDTTQGEREYRYPMNQRAAMLWYHDHRMDFTGPSVWHGLAGLHIVRDEEEAALRLPSGRYELPLALTDRSFDSDGSFLYPCVDRSLVNTPGVSGDFVSGVLGDVMLVNGVPWPITDVARATYRLRILNACNARRLRLRITPAPGAGLVQIGTDGGLLSSPIAHDVFELAPAQRLDALVDFTDFAAGTEVTLVDEFGEGAMRNVMRFRVTGEEGPQYAVPGSLSHMEVLDPSQAVTTRSFRFQSGDVDHRKGWIINSSPFSPATVAARPRLGEVEIWELYADSHHPVHVHLDPFQVIARGIGGPGRYDAGWKDTIDLSPGEQAKIAVRFTDYPGRFVFHCHNLEHEDMAMMANFVTNRSY